MSTKQKRGIKSVLFFCLTWLLVSCFLFNLVASIVGSNSAKAATTTYQFRDDSFKVIVGPEGTYQAVAGGSSGQYQLFVSGCNAYIIQTDSHKNAPGPATLNGGCDTVSNKKITIVAPTAPRVLTGTWVTHSVIKSGNLQFRDLLTDDTLGYQAYDGDSCQNQSVINGWPKGNGKFKGNADSNATATAKITLYAFVNSKCTSKGTFSIKLSDPDDAFQTYFVWDSSDTIKTSDGRAVFVLTENGSNVYKGLSGVKNDPTCPSTIKADSGALFGSFTMHNNKIADGYPDIVYDNGKYLTRVDGKCPTSEVSPAIAIGLNDRAKKEATGGGEAATLKNGDTCATNSGALGWIMCPVIRITDSALNFVDSQINNLLSVDGNKYDNPQLKQAWGSVRNIAFLILVPIMLVMVIGTAIGYSGIDAYTVKRAMPRLLLAVVFITLSYSICKFLIEISNVAGAGTLGILTQPFNKPGMVVGTLSLADLYGGSIITSIIALPVFAIGVALIVWLFGGTMLIFALIAMLVLLLRQMFIVALILAAPLAILAWIFPNNDKPWKFWWGTFSKLLIMYPLIMGLIAVGRIFAVILRYGGGSGLDGAIILPLMVMAAYMLPYALIPLTFRFAGGVFANLTGMINDRGKGLFDRQKERRAKKVENIAAERAFNPNNALGRALNRPMKRASQIVRGQAGFRPSRWQENLQSAADAEALERGLKESEEIPCAKSFFASDDLMMAGLESEGDFQKAVDYLSLSKDLGGAGWTMDQARLGAAQAVRMRKTMGAQAYDLAALAKLPATGTAFVGKNIGRWHKQVAARTRGNKSVQASLVAAAKGGFRSAQRYEASEASFGDHMAAITVADAGPVQGESTEAHTKRITDSIVDAAYQSGGAAAVVGARNKESAEMFAEAARRDLSRAFYEGPDDKRTPAQRRADQLRALAQVANIQDQLGGAKRSVSDVIAAGIMNFDIGGKSALDRVNAVRNDKDFQQARRELGYEERPVTPAEAARLASGQTTGIGGDLGGGLGGGQVGGPQPS